MTPGAIVAVAAYGLFAAWLCREMLRDREETREAREEFEAQLRLSELRRGEVIHFPARSTPNGNTAA